MILMGGLLLIHNLQVSHHESFTSIIAHKRVRVIPESRSNDGTHAGKHARFTSTTQGS